MNNEIHLGDCLDILQTLQDNSVHLCVSDPPYGISQLNSNWSKDKIDKSRKDATKTCCSVKKLPVGMKFDPQDAIELEKFLFPIAKQLFRVLLPGSFCVVFSQPRSAHRVAVAFENAGFEIRDQLVWDYGAGQGKAQSVANFIRKNNKMSEAEKERIIKELEGLKTPQLTPTFETMWLCQKPKQGTFVENYLEHGVSLVNFRNGCKKVKFEHNKPNKQERAECGDHPTIKPISLIKDLIETFSCSEGQVVLDCFLGSGTTAVAALQTNRKFIGIEKEEEYYNIAKKRIKNLNE